MGVKFLNSGTVLSCAQCCYLAIFASVSYIKITIVLLLQDHCMHTSISMISITPTIAMGAQWLLIDKALWSLERPLVVSLVSSLTNTGRLILCWVIKQIVSLVFKLSSASNSILHLQMMTVILIDICRLWDISVWILKPFSCSESLTVLAIFLLQTYLSNSQSVKDHLIGSLIKL